MLVKVVDASVLAATVYDEPRAEEARALLFGFEIYAPTLLVYELTNTARKKIRQDPARRDSIIQSLEDALAMDIHLTEIDHVATLQLALATGLSTYDASYLHLSRTLGAPLVTFDEKLGAAVADERR